MAFQQPTRLSIQRAVREASDDRSDSQAHIATVAGPLQPTESQTWVLFSPAADTDSTTVASSALTSLPDSQPTPGRSRLSDFGSLHSLDRSNYASSYTQSGPAQLPRPPISLLTSSLSNLEAAQDTEDDAELDSLDSHLADFRTVPSSQAQAPASAVHGRSAAFLSAAATTVNLPTHDGLGSFRLGNTMGMGSAVQEHIYAFEQFNPRRVTKRRRESLEQAQLQVEQELSEELERVRRIEAWRWEHSRVLLEEIQKETRRRRGSLSSRRSRAGTATAADATTSSESAVAGDSTDDWHDQEEDDGLLRKRKEPAGDEAAASEGLWSRITRKFMVEVMGIDDRILSIIFGEALSETDEQEEDEEVDLSSTPKASELMASPLRADEPAAVGYEHLTQELAQEDSSSSWQLRMIERIAKELGQLVHRHMSAHPGAFSTFVRVQQMPLPYAGLPVIPEGVTPHSRELAEGGGSAVETDAAAAAASATTSSLPAFQPTIYQAKQMNMPKQASEGTQTPAASAAATVASTLSTGPTFTQEEWEKDLDITLVFRYLRSRFMSDTATPTSHALPSLQRRSSIGMQDAAAKAARVRQHHPLVGRTAPRQTGERRPAQAFRNTPASPIANRAAAPSCASQSTRRSARRSSVSSRHSSRHYWDIGGSGSMIASGGPMGSWGDL